MLIHIQFLLDVLIFRIFAIYTLFDAMGLDGIRFVNVDVVSILFTNCYILPPKNLVLFGIVCHFFRLLISFNL